MIEWLPWLPSKSCYTNLKFFETLKDTPNPSKGFRFVAFLVLEILGGSFSTPPPLVLGVGTKTLGARRVNERIQMQSVDLPSDQSPILLHKTKFRFCFSSGTPLDPCELLFYACLKTEFQEKAFKSRSYKYENVSRVIDIVYKRKYSTVSMRNFIYRTNNGVGHGFGKEKGRIKWYFYYEYTSKLIEEHKIVIASLLSKPNESFSFLEITELTGFIDQLCCSAKKFLEQENGIIDDETKLDYKIVDSQIKAILKTFDSWSHLLDGSNDILHLYYFRKSRNLQMYPELEILVENNCR